MLELLAQVVQQHFRIERLTEPAIDSFQVEALRRVPGDPENLEPAVARVATYLTDRGRAITAWQDHVQEDDVGRCLRTQVIESIDAIGRDVHIHTGKAQKASQQLALILIVLDEKGLRMPGGLDRTGDALFHLHVQFLPRAASRNPL